MSATMSPDLLMALDASFSAGGWRTVGVQLDEHTETVPGDPSAIPPTAPSSTTHISATLQVENEARGVLLIFVLKGTDPGGYTSGTLIAGGGSYRTSDATLIGRLAATIEPALAAMQAALADGLAEGL